MTNPYGAKNDDTTVDDNDGETLPIQELVGSDGGPAARSASRWPSGSGAGAGREAGGLPPSSPDDGLNYGQFFSGGGLDERAPAGGVAAPAIPSRVMDLGADAVHDYLFLRQVKGWSDADATAAVSPVDVSDPRLYATKGAPYRESQVKDWSHYDDDIEHSDGEPTGRSRRWGDAAPETQHRAMEAIVAAGKTAGMSDDQIALTLAIARHESGFNPDAAAGTTSASGLGQFIDKTGVKYGLNDGNRWNVKAQADALVRHTLQNMQLASARGHGGKDLARYTYAYHHDGPSLQYGGLTIADRKVVPLVNLYQRYMEAVGPLYENQQQPGGAGVGGDAGHRADGVGAGSGG